MAVQNQNLPQKSPHLATKATATTQSNVTQPLAKTRTKFGQAAAVVTTTSEAANEMGHNTQVTGGASVMPSPAGVATSAAAPNGGPRVSFNRDVHVKRIG